jgi:hypothetical protein
MEITGPLRDLVQRRIGFAMGRVAGAIDEVSLVLGEASETARHERVGCSVRVRFGGGGRGQVVKVEEVGGDVGIVFDLALERAARGVQRKLELDHRGYARGRREEPS